MNHASYFFWLAGQAFGGVIYFWPVSLVLSAALIASMAMDVKRGRMKANRRIAWLAMPMLGTILMLVVGVVFEKREAMAFLPYVVLAIVFALCVWTVYKSRGFRITAAAVSLQILWLSLWCGFVTVMSITGDWL
jgi:hypothetical protein